METPLLAVKGLGVKIDQKEILEALDFEVNQNETVAIIGPNGAGKTVLFRALIGQQPYSGEIKWKEGVKIGYVPQRMAIDADLPLTVAEFFALKSPIKSDVSHALEIVSSKDLLKRRLSVLSGGELQRVLIAWAVVGHPDILLFDEPTSGVDISAEESIYSLLHKLQEKEGLAVLIISHDLQIVYRYADNVICLNKRRMCYGPPQHVLNAESLAKIYGADVGLFHHEQHNNHG